MTLYVADTCSIISFYPEVFPNGNSITQDARDILSKGINDRYANVQISIPSVVFIEIFEKWLDSEEFVKKFYFDVYYPLRENPDVELREIDEEVLSALIKIGGNLSNHEINDKLVLASAIVLNCPLISSDGEIKKYVDATGAIPRVIA